MLFVCGARIGRRVEARDVFRIKTNEIRNDAPWMETQKQTCAQDFMAKHTVVRKGPCFDNNERWTSQGYNGLGFRGILVQGLGG